jgi:KDO2-lipid IV(A) lauroyltransferase
MHQDTVTMTGGAGLAVKLDMVVAYLRFQEREGGGYRLSVVPICEHAAQMAPAEIMNKYYQLLEEDLEEQPWNYLWTHKRWK